MATAAQEEGGLRTRRRRRPLPERIVACLPILGAISILLAWQFLVPALGVPAFILPTPTQILAKIRSDFPVLIDAFWPTLIESAVGFLIGNLIAIVLAIGFVHSWWAERAYFPAIIFFNTIPVVALAPIIIMVVGLGMASKIVIVALICFFPTLINMTRGLQAVSRTEIELMHILSASRAEIFWKLRVPRSIPYLFSSLRIASTTSVVGAIVGEWIGANKGLGTVIIQATFSFRSDLLYAALTLSSSLAILIFSIVVLVERSLVRYRQLTRA